MKKDLTVKIRFSPDEIKCISERAEKLNMKFATFIRNMSLCKEWRIFDTKTVCETLMLMNRIGLNFSQIIKIAEETDSAYLDEIRTMKNEFDSFKDTITGRCETLLNRH